MAILLANQEATSFATVSVNLNYVRGKAWRKKGSGKFQNKKRINGQTPPSSAYTPFGRRCGHWRSRMGSRDTNGRPGCNRCCFRLREFKIHGQLCGVSRRVAHIGYSVSSGGSTLDAAHLTSPPYGGRRDSGREVNLKFVKKKKGQVRMSN